MSNVIKKFIQNKVNKVKDPNERLTRTISTTDLRDYAPKNPNPNSSDIIYINSRGYRCLYDDRDSKHQKKKKQWRDLTYKLFMEDELKRQKQN